MVPIFGPKSPFKIDDEMGWSNLLTELESWRETPYSWLQRTKKRGTDCTSFICQALINVGYLKRFDWPDYYRPDWYTNPNDDFLYHNLKDNFDRYHHENLFFKFIETDSIWEDYLKGDILLFKIRKNVRVYNHSTILAENFQMYHISSTSSLQLIEFDHRWKNKCKGLFRICLAD